MEWKTENNNIDDKKLYIALAILILIALAAYAMYYFVAVKSGSPAQGEKTTVQRKLSEQEKTEIEKNLAGDVSAASLSKKQKAVIEKNFANSGKTLTEEEKRQIEKNFGL